MSDRTPSPHAPVGRTAAAPVAPIDHLRVGHPERAPATMCECEHLSHFSSGPRGPGHPYGECFSSVAALATDYGTFNVCGSCRDAGHMVRK